MVSKNTAKSNMTVMGTNMAVPKLSSKSPPQKMLTNGARACHPSARSDWCMHSCNVSVPPYQFAAARVSSDVPNSDVAVLIP